RMDHAYASALHLSGAIFVLSSAGPLLRPAFAQTVVRPSRAAACCAVSSMQSTVCTVAEGAYHFGVAALCNSLYRHGFRGRVFVFYRGDLPAWASDATDAGPWRELVVADDFAVCFVL